MHFLVGETITSDQGNGPSGRREGRKFWISPDNLAGTSDFPPGTPEEPPELRFADTSWRRRASPPALRPPWVRGGVA